MIHFMRLYFNILDGLTPMVLIEELQSKGFNIPSYNENPHLCNVYFRGLVPKNVLVDAGKFFLKKQKRSLGSSEEEIIKIATFGPTVEFLIITPWCCSI